MSWLKAKYKKLLAWFSLPVALAGVLGATIPPEATTYRVPWTVAYDVILCRGEADPAFCNEQAFLKNESEHPTDSTYTGSQNKTKGTYELTRTLDHYATSSAAFEDWYTKRDDAKEPGKRGFARTLLGNYVPLYPLDSLKEASRTRTRALKNSFSLITTARAGFPTEDFESYSGGDLEGGSGGTGWAANWGATVGCGVAWNTDGASLSGVGGRSAKNTVGNDDQCGRTYTAVNTVNQIIQFWASCTKAAGQHCFLTVGTTGARDEGMMLWFRTSDETLFVYDNITLTAILTPYGSGTAYKLNFKIIDFTNGQEFYQVSLDGGAYSSSYRLYDYTNVNYSSGVSWFAFQDGNGNTFIIDDISDATVVAGGSVKSPEAVWFE